MNNTSENLRRLGDTARNIVYPLIPIFGIASIWAFAMAKSLESKVERELGPLAKINVKMVPEPPTKPQLLVSADLRD